MANQGNSGWGGSWGAGGWGATPPSGGLPPGGGWGGPGGGAWSAGPAPGGGWGPPGGGAWNAGPPGGGGAWGAPPSSGGWGGPPAWGGPSAGASATISGGGWGAAAPAGGAWGAGTGSSGGAWGSGPSGTSAGVPPAGGGWGAAPPSDSTGSGASMPAVGEWGVPPGGSPGSEPGGPSGGGGRAGAPARAPTGDRTEARPAATAPEKSTPTPMPAAATKSTPAPSGVTVAGVGAQKEKAKEVAGDKPKELKGRERTTVKRAPGTEEKDFYEAPHQPLGKLEESKLFLMKMMVNRGPTGIYRLGAKELPNRSRHAFHQLHPSDDVEVCGNSVDIIRQDGRAGMAGPAVDRVRKHIYYIDNGRPQRLVRKVGYEPDAPRQVLFESEMITDPTNNNRDGKRGRRNQGQYSGASTNELTTGWFQQMVAFDELRQRVWWVGGGMGPILYSADVKDVPVPTKTDIDEDWRSPSLVEVVERIRLGSGQYYQMTVASDGSVFFTHGGGIERYNPLKDATTLERFIGIDDMPGELTKGRKRAFGGVDVVRKELHPEGKEVVYFTFGSYLLYTELKEEEEDVKEKTLIFAPMEGGVGRFDPRMRNLKTVGPCKNTEIMGPVVDQQHRKMYWIHCQNGGKASLKEYDISTGASGVLFELEGDEAKKMRPAGMNKLLMAYCALREKIYWTGTGTSGPRVGTVYALQLRDTKPAGGVEVVTNLPGDFQHGQMACDSQGRLYITTLSRGPGVFRCDPAAGSGFVPFIEEVAVKQEEWFRGCYVAGGRLYFTKGFAVIRCPLDDPSSQEPVGRPDKDDQDIFSICVDQVNGIIYSCMSAFAPNEANYIGSNYLKKMSFNSAHKSVYVRLHRPPVGLNGMAIVLPQSQREEEGAMDKTEETGSASTVPVGGPPKVGWLFVPRIMIDRTARGTDGIWKLDLGTPGRSLGALQQPKTPYEFRCGHSFGGGLEAMALDKVNRRCLWIEKTNPARLFSCSYGGTRTVLYTAAVGEMGQGNCLAYDPRMERVYWLANCRTPGLKLIGLRVSPGKDSGLPVPFAYMPRGVRSGAMQMTVGSAGHVFVAFGVSGVLCCAPNEENPKEVEWTPIAGTDQKSCPARKGVSACEVVPDDPDFPGKDTLYFGNGPNVYKIPLNAPTEAGGSITPAGEPVLVGKDLSKDQRAHRSRSWHALAVDLVNRTVYLKTGAGSMQNGVRWHAMEEEHQLPEKEAYYNFSNSMRCHGLAVHPGGKKFDPSAIEPEATDAERRGTGLKDNILSAGTKKKTWDLKEIPHGEGGPGHYMCLAVDAMGGRAYLCNFGKSSQSYVKFVDLNDPKAIDQKKAFYNFPSCQVPHCLVVHPETT